MMEQKPIRALIVGAPLHIPETDQPVGGPPEAPSAPNVGRQATTTVTSFAGASSGGVASSSSVAASPSKPLPGEAALDERLLDEAVADLNRIYTSKALETARLIGKYILERFFSGDISRFRDQGRRHVSFRHLSQRQDLRFSYSYLWTCVAVVEQFECLPEDLAEALPLSHHRLLLPIRDPSEKARLAQLAISNNLSKREFATAVRPSRASEKGTKPLLAPGEHPISRALSQIKTVLNEALASPGLDDLESLPRIETETVISEIEDEVEKLSMLLRTLRNRSNGVHESSKGTRRSTRGKTSGERTRR